MPEEGSASTRNAEHSGGDGDSVVTVGSHPGPWPVDFPIPTDGKVARGLVVWSLSGEIEGRTTGGRTPCISNCDGWFIGVKWETGQQMHICSKGWKYDPDTQSIRVVAGGELSARVTDEHAPTPRDEWPDRSALGPAWRVRS